MWFRMIFFPSRLRPFYLFSFLSTLHHSSFVFFECLPLGIFIAQHCMITLSDSFFFLFPISDLTISRDVRLHV